MRLLSGTKGVLLSDATKQMHKAFGAIGGKAGIMNAAKGA